MTQEYIDKGGLPNQELAIEIYPYAKVANQLRLLVRIALFIACFKWPKLNKLIIYFECFNEVLAAGMPQEINTTADINYSIMIITVNYIIFYFDFFSGSVASTLALAPLFVKRAIFHNEDAIALAGRFLMASLFQLLNLWALHMTITKVGMIYVDAEVLRQGNN